MMDRQALRATETFGWYMKKDGAQHGKIQGVAVDPLLCMAVVLELGYQPRLVRHKPELNDPECWQRWEVDIREWGSDDRCTDIHPTFSPQKCGNGVCVQGQGPRRRWVDIPRLLERLQDAHHLFACVRRSHRPAAGDDDDDEGKWWLLSTAQRALEHRIGWIEEAREVLREAIDHSDSEMTRVVAPLETPPRGGR